MVYTKFGSLMKIRNIKTQNIKSTIKCGWGEKELHDKFNRIFTLVRAVKMKLYYIRRKNIPTEKCQAFSKFLSGLIKSRYDLSGPTKSNAIKELSKNTF